MSILQSGELMPLYSTIDIKPANFEVGYSDPVVLYGKAIAQRIKGTPGITG